MKNTNLCRFFRRNGSTVLSIVASVGVIGTALLSGKGTYDALKELKKRKEKDDNLTKKDKFLIALPHYIPALSIGASTIACILGINVLNKKQQNAINSAYLLLSNSYSEYRRKVKELNGEDADFGIISSLASEKFPSGKIPENKILFYDEYSQRYFVSTMEDVYAAIYHYNRNFQLRGVAALNEFYDFLGIDRIESGDYMGFNWHEMAEDGLTPWIDIHTRRAIYCDGKEFCIISFDWNPIPDYENWDFDCYANLASATGEH